MFEAVLFPLVALVLWLLGRQHFFNLTTGAFEVCSITLTPCKAE